MSETIVLKDVQTASTASEPLAVARGRVVFDPAWCRTCRVCEIACSISKEGQARPSVARIDITFDEFAASEQIAGKLCRQCADAPCLGACRVDAMSRDVRTGAVLIDHAKCIGCMRCAKACPHGIVKRHPDRKIALKCDLCSERADGPQCVKVCPLAGKALRYEPDFYAKGSTIEDPRG
jgi:anaerobic carbon-monoxide dehydrogenase iron sulfur subunit